MQPVRTLPNATFAVLNLVLLAGTIAGNNFFSYLIFFSHLSITFLTLYLCYILGIADTPFVQTV